RGRHQAGQLAGLEHLLYDEPLLPRQAAVVRAGDLAFVEVVEPEGQPFGGATAVYEQDRRAVFVDEAQELWIDGGPDRAPRRLAARQRIKVNSIPTHPIVGLDHRLDRDVDLQVEGLAHPGVDDPAVAPRADHE